jgi:integrase
MKDHRETPSRRRNPGGEARWIARYTAPDGRRLSAGTFKLKRDAQDAIDAAYQRPQSIETVGAYAATWTDRHPRSTRTNRTNDHRISRLLDVKLEGIALRYWALADLRRRHANDLVAHMLIEQGRSPSGAVDVLRAFSAMCEDAITDELSGANPFKGVKVRANDPRATKKAREPRVFSPEQLHAFAAEARQLSKPNAEPMLRTLIDCGLRLGELLGLERRDLDGDVLHVRGSAHNGVFAEGDQPTKRHVRDIPVPPTLASMLDGMPRRIDTPLLFPTVSGKLWWQDNWRRDIWNKTQRLAGLDVSPHECRHSWVSHLSAAGVDAADLADMAGHSKAVADARYRHALRRSHNAVREALG